MCSLRPKRIKFAKYQRGRLKCSSPGIQDLLATNLPSFTLISTESCYVTNNHLSVAIKLIKKKLVRKGILRLHVFPDKPFTSKSIGARMGKGKGAISIWKAKVSPGSVIFSISGVSETIVVDAFNSISKKFPCSVKVVKRNFPASFLY